MSLNVKAITNVALNLNATPYDNGFDAVLFNNSAAVATLMGSDDGVTYTNVANAVGVAIGSMTQVKLQAYMKLAAAGANVFLLT